MKTTAQKEVAICDICQKEASYSQPCDSCGKDICYECSKANAVDYPHGVHFSGSCDGKYCNECDARLRASGTEKRHSAYLAIQSLRKEEDAFSKDFHRRAKAAEAHLESLAK